jgi:hypothetical protein
VSSRSVAMVMPFCRIGRARRGLQGDHPTAGGPGLHRRAQRQRPERERRTAGGGYFASRCKAGFRPAAENSRRPPLRTRAACRPIALLKAASAARSGKERITREPMRSKLEGEPRTSSSRSGLVRRPQESRHVLRGKLHAQGCSKMIHAQTAEVFVEIAQRRRQRERLDPGGLRPVGQGRRRQVASWVVVAHDIKPS